MRGADERKSREHNTEAGEGGVCSHQDPEQRVSMRKWPRIMNGREGGGGGGCMPCFSFCIIGECLTC